MNILPIAEAAEITDVTSLIDFLSNVLANGVLPLLITLAVIGFVYGIVKYFLNPDNEEKRKNGKEFMTWGLISLFVMVSFWGIINIFKASLTDGVSDEVKIPKIPLQE